MTFVSDPRIQRKFNRTSHHTDPRWKAGHPARSLLVGLTVGVPAVLVALCLIFRPLADRVPLAETALLAVTLPELFLLPVTFIRYAGDRGAYRCASSGRFGDELVFLEGELRYSYYQQRNNNPSNRYETTLPYRLIDQAVVLPDRQVLRVHGGGSDALYDAQGALLRESSFRTGSVWAHDCLRWVEIPLTYRDNDAFLEAFARKTGVVPVTDGTHP